MTIDQFAIAVNEEFNSIRNEMQEGFHSIREETKEDLKNLKVEMLAAFDALHAHLSAYASRTNEDIARLNESVQELDGRVRVLEKRKK